MTDMIQLLEHAATLNLFRALDIQFAQLVTNNSQPARLLAAACLSAKVGDGHVCLPLSQLTCELLFKGRHPELAHAIWKAAGQPKDWYTIFYGWSAISIIGSKTAPIVLVADRLYLHRLWQDEGKIARFFQQQSILQDFEFNQVRIVLDQFFGTQEENFHKIAAAAAITQKITIICGGPGTGKTTTVAKLLAALIRLSKGKIRIQLTAPTGKAAARLSEALHKTLHQLSISKNEENSFPKKAVTLHCLLGAHPQTQRLHYHDKHHLHLDVLVVDETSMVDLSMMTKLIAALPLKARVIFLGDHHQLASVEVGAIFGDICRCAEAGYSTVRASQLRKLTGCYVYGNNNAYAPVIRDSICLLRKNYRFHFNSGIAQLASAVLNGNTQLMEDLLKSSLTDINRHSINSSQTYETMLEQVIEGYSPILRLIQKNHDPIEILTAFNLYQLLCVLREGPFGIEGLNQRIEQKLRKMQLIRCSCSINTTNFWYQGRPIMVTRNDSILGLSNGDVGITMYDRQGFLKVFFLLDNNKVKMVQPNRLPTHNTTWAMTVHKSQGSEFDHVALVMPTHCLPVLTRELIYTAITRARNKLTLYGDHNIFSYAIQLRTQRNSGLLERLCVSI
ncbi:exodeoxyribonuclease V subunit alpha [Candidatus Pantoea carbekii]|uniref:RecBCD enzyme subunit RecD n=1 Tax=Candidatus Pantoea carbekii TaxID=1235990 RepID=U3U703_9GAMM|nr:exodeoxyribonuclease V subunit alpha [Candidatus Pantoea carbekii]AKC32403.1 exodeoxyribonuclease V alpha chain RecD [Candidatus Pantoea carbekii]BAO00127.1 hypothetical protein HHS_01570 [Candidatus Pantoea carbekii]